MGTRRIGVAKGDTEVRLASPLEPVMNDGKALDCLANVVRRNDVAIVVVGLPRNSRGEETKQSLYSRQFADNLGHTLANNNYQAEIVFQDESLTSIEAENVLKRDKRHYNSKMLRDGTLDSEAAVIILGDYLEGARHED